MNKLFPIVLALIIGSFGYSDFISLYPCDENASYDCPNRIIFSEFVNGENDIGSVFSEEYFSELNYNDIGILTEGMAAIPWNGGWAGSLTEIDTDRVYIVMSSSSGFYNYPNAHLLDCKDLNIDTNIDILDILVLVNFIINDNYHNFTAYLCSDLNDDDNTDLLDIILLVNWIISRVE